MLVPVFFSGGAFGRSRKHFAVTWRTHLQFSIFFHSSSEVLRLGFHSCILLSLFLMLSLPQKSPPLKQDAELLASSLRYLGTGYAVEQEATLSPLSHKIHYHCQLAQETYVPKSSWNCWLLVHFLKEVHFTNKIDLHMNKAISTIDRSTLFFENKNARFFSESLLVLTTSRSGLRPALDSKHTSYAFCTWQYCIP